MDKLLHQRIARARYLLDNSLHIAMATVNADGSPHNTPLFYCYDPRGYMYWSSSYDAMHSENIRRTGQAFFALYESQAGGGLFMKANEAKELADDELASALGIFNERLLRCKKTSVSLTHFVGGGPQRMYSAQIANFYVNYSTHDKAGRVAKDTRQEISRHELEVTGILN